MPLPKSPIHPLAARLDQVHPSSATWVGIERLNGAFSIFMVGRFSTKFRMIRWLGNSRVLSARFINEFRGNNGENSVYEVRATEIGLMPHSESSGRGYYWDNGFVVKLQKAHQVFGCSPREFREGPLAEAREQIGLCYVSIIRI